MGKIAEIFAKLRVWGAAGIKDYVSKKIAWWRMARRLRVISEMDDNEVPSRGITLIGDFKQGEVIRRQIATLPML